ncbi:CynX/NimT family MFS transporter [Corynebacterium anserum]|nr:MFS transporter [Corynebacterium anserum]
MSSRHKQMSTVLCVAAVLAFSINLRAGIVSLGPVLGQVRDTLKVSTSAAGVFTALPGFAFAVMGWCTVPLARRIGLSPALLTGGTMILTGLAARPFLNNYWPFLLLTGLAVCGIAVGNVLLPAWIQSHAVQNQRLLLMTIYTTVIGLSASVGPLSAMWFGDENSWRAVLGVWAIPAAILVCVWLVVCLRIGSGDLPHPTSAHSSASEQSMWSSPTAVAMLVFFSLQSAGFYTQIGWLPQLMMDRGVEHSTASVALIVLGFMGVIGGVIMPTVVARIRNITPLAISITLLTMTGWVGLLWNTAAAPLLWAVLLGLGGFSFPLALALLSARTRSPLVTARLSGFVQPYGYLVAGAVPLVVGVLYSAVGSWTLILSLLLALGSIQLLASTRCARNVTIDKELELRATAHSSHMAI